MCAHDSRLSPPRAFWTSAELSRFDSHFDSPWDELRVCREAVLADWDDAPVPAEIVREYRRHSVQEVRAAALRVEQAVQDRLWGLGGAGTVIGHTGYARGLWDAQWQAHSAIVAKTASRKEAKTLQKSAARGRSPLTVCVGRRQRRFKPDHEAVMRFNAPDMFTKEHPDYVPYVPLGYGDGCRLIIVDTSDARPSPPRKYCDRCAAKAGNTMNAGLAKNALARLRASRKLG
jgi:hypothetical protein